MLNFEFYSPTKFVFGKGAEEKVGEKLHSMGIKRVLLHYGKGSVIRSGLLDRVKHSLSDWKIEFVQLGGVQPNPLLSLVREGIELCRQHKVELVLCVGGGSAIDSGKFIAVGACYKGAIDDIFWKRAEITEALPVATVLTIAAAGSEGSLSAVVTDDESKIKSGIRSDLVRPKISFMNPQMLATVPPYQIACGISDMLAHIFERYFSNTPMVELTDRLCEALVKVIVEKAEKFVLNPADYDSAADIMWAGTLAHNDICGVGRVQDWASHRMEHQFSSLFGLAHGAGLAIIMPKWFDYVMKVDIKRFARISRFVFPTHNALTDIEAAHHFVHSLRELYKRIGLPTTFEEAGITQQQIQQALDTTPLIDNSLGEFMRLTKQDIANILFS